MSRKKKTRDSNIKNMRVFLGTLALIASLFLAYWLVVTLQFKDCANTVAREVHRSAEIVNRPSTKYRHARTDRFINISYSFNVGGESYAISRRTRYYDASLSDSGEIQVFYNPQNPKQAFFSRSQPFRILVRCMAVLGVLGLIWIIVEIGARKKT